MPIIKSAIKRVRQQERRRKRNLITTRKSRTLIKEFTLLVEAKKIAEATTLYPMVQKSIDMSVKKNLLHQNTAGRMKSRMAKMISSQAKPKVADKKPAKKAPAKKAVAKKTTKK